MKIHTEKPENKKGGLKVSLTITGADFGRWIARMVSDRVGPMVALEREVDETFAQAVEEGNLTEAQAGRKAKEIKKDFREGLSRLQEMPADARERLFHSVGVATTRDISSLERRLDSIEAKLAKVTAGRKKTTTKSRKKKTTTLRRAA